MLQTYSQTISTLYNGNRKNLQISLINSGNSLSLANLISNSSNLSAAFNVGYNSETPNVVVDNTIIDQHEQNLNTPTFHLYSEYGNNIVVYYVPDSDFTFTLNYLGTYALISNGIADFRSTVRSAISAFYGVNPDSCIPVSIVHLEKYTKDTAPEV